MVVGTSVGAVGVLIGRGDGNFGTATPYDFGAAATRLAIGDFNNDGNVDIAAEDYLANNVSILTGTEDGTFVVQPISFGVGAVPVSIAAGDLNGDGKLDLVVGVSPGINVLMNVSK